MPKISATQTRRSARIAGRTNPVNKTLESVKVPAAKDKTKSYGYKLRKINEMTENVYEKSQALSQSVSEMLNARKRLQHCLEQIIRQEDNIRTRLVGLQNTKNGLERMADEMSASYKFENKDYQAQLNVNIVSAMEDGAIAQKQIDQIKFELDYQSPVVPESRDGGFQAYRCYDKVIIPGKPLSTMPQINKKNYGTCLICYENEINRVIIGCGHTCVCHKCAPKLLYGGCPICRLPIKDIIEPKLL